MNIINIIQLSIGLIVGLILGSILGTIKVKSNLMKILTDRIVLESAIHKIKIRAMKENKEQLVKFLESGPYSIQIKNGENNTYALNKIFINDISEE